MTLTPAVVVIGGGQAGLSLASCLRQRRIEPLVLERHRIAHAWQHQRWDSFCLVTPNWQCRLPGFPYDGDDPHGFMGREAIVAYLQRFAERAAVPVREGVSVERLQSSGDGYRLLTSAGVIEAEQVVIATGAYHRPRRHPLAERLPATVLQLDARDYRRPDQLPVGPVLVVGSGQSGCQIAEDLALAGRRVHLSVGSAPRSPRRYRGRDVVEWLERMGVYDTPIDAHEDPRAVRHKTNHYLTGRDGGREIDLRQRAREGMVLHGRLEGISPTGLSFAANLAANLEAADAVYRRIRGSIDAWIADQGLEAPIDPPYEPCWSPPPDGSGSRLELAEEPLAAVIWCTGYRADFSWVEVPVFDGGGEPVHQRGVTQAPGLYFIGLPWLHTWGSGRFCGVGGDADHLAQVIQRRQMRRDGSQEALECTALLGS
ncbi:MSMEG_0569 family flavin-dependent oxidoreductase [Synechococcus sp. BSF8S]|uniref:MSMEG_0569 family flavin-dependent oxidoreductase n=1 Tax=Synechococcales TaxID=1890424 RepID=UPI0016264E47|nr:MULTISPECIES: MSMEG_0569 family flavin-dependent oxidoreductase [unclassified Synechococcus]MBC1260448.1 MSMEG_0569 family flavin-dependent oxidoreductase [Synechococcus sp. BSF8S]MBC1263819.1 MSMEG_0569 family flavin-dependent oxidoreductase [Synechococcus sp. BSA11S]